MTVHTLELLAFLTTKEYHRLRDCFFSHAVGQSALCYESHRTVYFNQWNSWGVQCCLKKTPVGGVIHFRINPSKLIGNPSPTALFEARGQNIDLLNLKISDILNEFPVQKKIEDLGLFRLDLCADIPMKESWVLEYIRLLHKGHKTGKWEPVYFQDERDHHSFREKNKRYQLTVYDKLYELSEKGRIPSAPMDERILRIEVSLNAKGMNHYHYKCDMQSDTSCLDKLSEFSEAGRFIMVDVINKIFPYSPYFSLRKARELIYQSDFHRPKQGKLCGFLAHINRYRHVDTHALSMTKNGKKRLEQLDRLGINPVTIDARSGIPFLPPLQYLVKLYERAKRPDGRNVYCFEGDTVCKNLSVR